MGKSVIIIGAGIGGLATGCYARMNGYTTSVFEMHDKPGGLCTAWDRKGYTVDGCLHWLTGSAPGTDMYKLWQELGMIQGQQIYNNEIFYSYESSDGRIFSMYTDASKLENHMLEIAPEDKVAIRQTVKAIRTFTRLGMPVDKAPELYNMADGLRLMFQILPVLGDFSHYSRVTVQEFAERFSNPLLKQAWASAWLPQFSSLFLLITLALMHKKQAGYVIGGSMKLSRAIEKRYRDLGGEINYRARVSKILVENDRAVGIVLEDGSVHRSDYVVSAADGHATIFDMLEGKYVDDKVRAYYGDLSIFQPLIYIGLGVNRTFKDVPLSISGLILELEKPVTIAGSECKSLSVRIHGFDPSLAPQGKTLVTVMIESNYDYWARLHEDSHKYREEKERVADIAIEQIERRFPGFRSQVEMIDVATPVTFKRYTGNWQGSYEGWQITPEIVSLSMGKTLPGLDNFFMAGQWVMPGGGIPSGAMAGRYVTQIMCKRDGLKFKATMP
jgi:phytoene dehydrogenase-like protein